MKKIITSLLSMALVSGMAVAAPVSAKQFKGHMSNGLQTSKQIKVEGHNSMAKSEALFNSEARKAKKKVRAAVEGELGSDIIYEAPESAKKQTYLHSANSWYVLWSITCEYFSGQPTEIAIDGDDIYIKDMIITANLGTYVKGTIEGDKIKMSFPQTVALDEYEGEPFTYSIRVMEYDYDDDWYYVADDQDVEFSIGEDGSIIGDPKLDGDFILALYDDDWDDWSAFGDFDIEFQKFDADFVKVPDGAKHESWIMTSYDNAYKCDVAFDGDDVYVGGIYADYPDAYVKGTIQGDKISFKSGQMMCIDEYFGVIVYFIGGIMYEEDDELYADMVDEIIFEYDAEGKVMTMDDDQVIFINAAPDEIYFIDMIDTLKIFYQSDDVVFTNPRDPYDLQLADYKDFDGSDVFIFYLPMTDTEGNYLSIDHMYYNVFVDDEIYEFTTDLYDIEENVADVPYEFTDYYDIWSAGEHHEAALYGIENAKKVGVQQFFVDKEGNVLSSNIVSIGYYSAVESSLIKKSVKSTEYYDLSGRKVVNPTAGMYIRSDKFDDGTVSNTKVAFPVR